MLEAQVTTVAALAQALAGLNGELVTITGSAATEVAKMLGEAGITTAIAGDATCADIITVAALAALDDAESPPVPLYLRPPDAKPQTGMAVARK